MINLTATTLSRCITHQVGNRLHEEEIVLSTAPTVIPEASEAYFLEYLLMSFKVEEPYRFVHPTDIGLNEVYSVVNTLFEKGEDLAAFVEASHDLAKLLYECSTHPKIKTGRLNVVQFEDILIEDETFSGIGIFKSETESPFLKMLDSGASVTVKHDVGYEVKGIDKGCIIINTSKEDGYRLLVIEKKNADTRYWVDEFLKIRPVSTAYAQTQQAMSMTQQFLTREAPKKFEIEKTEQMNLLNKSVEYFAKKENFNRGEFEDEILQDERLIDAYRSFNDSFKAEHDSVFNDEFSISPQAYKKQSKIFKSILKLDRNFHVYIHGDKDQITRVVDADGRKFYKLYYSEER
jgi:hypothetical protein